ncbi:MAG: substrate-binding domain-containing protein, partial [Sphingorhabdus sp.]
DGLFAQGDFSYESGAMAAKELLSLADRPTAIIACNDQMALAVLDVATANGLKIPDDLSLISFDNSSVVRFTEPQLTAIDQPIAATFSKAVELLITVRHSTASEHPVVVKGSLVERGSTAPLATNARG